MDTASVTCRLRSLRACASILMELGTPTVDMVMWRAPTPMSRLMNSADASTARQFRQGSPCPMYTVTHNKACLSLLETYRLHMGIGWLGVCPFL